MSYLSSKTRYQQVLAAYRFQKYLRNIQANCFHNRTLIGKREVVGYGFNGSYSYFDATDMPYPAIRFREETEEIKRLREKEKNDWKNLTLEEKKKRTKLDLNFI